MKTLTVALLLKRNLHNSIDLENLLCMFFSQNFGLGLTEFLLFRSNGSGTRPSETAGDIISASKKILKVYEIAASYGTH